MLYKVMSDEAGFESSLCRGLKDGIHHYWNETMIEGERYLVDISGGGHQVKISDAPELLMQYRDNSGQLFYPEK